MEDQRQEELIQCVNNLQKAMGCIGQSFYKVSRRMTDFSHGMTQVGEMLDKRIAARVDFSKLPPSERTAVILRWGHDGILDWYLWESTREKV